jgi:hypothetical protein
MGNEVGNWCQCEELIVPRNDMTTTKTKYRVKFQIRGVTKYGIVETLSKEAKKAEKEGFVLVCDAIRPISYKVKDAHLVDIPFHSNYDEDEYNQYVSQEFEKAIELAKQTPKKGVHVNSYFDIGVADGSAHYVVTEVNGKTCDVEWRGFSGDRYSDHHFAWGGVFPTKTVKAYVEQHRAMDELFGSDRNEQWYSTLKVGEIVHYDHGFGKDFLRCEVVMGSTKQSPKKVQKCLKPIAMVGEWRHDRPRRFSNGQLHLPYAVKEILSGDLMRPHYTSIYECSEYSQRPQGLNPLGLTPIDLNVPPFEGEEEIKAGFHRAVDVAKEALEFDCDKNPKQMLEAAMKVIQDALNGSCPSLEEIERKNNANAVSP